MDRLPNLCALIALYCAINAGAAPIVFVGKQADAVVTDTKVCFYAAGTDSFVKKYLSSNVTRCMPANQTLDVPPGDWNVYLSSGNRLVSGHPLFVHIGSTATVDAEDRIIEVPMLPAANVVFGPRVIASHRGYGAVYITNEGEPQSPAGVRPVPAGASEVLVPARMTIVPMLVRDGTPVWIGTPTSLEPDQRLLIDETREPAGADVAVVVSLGDAQVQRIRDARDADVLSLSLMRGDVEIKTAIPLRPAPEFERSLALFENVPPGQYRLIAHGEDWSLPETTIKVARSDAVVLDEVIPQFINAATVRWNIHPPATIREACDDVDAPKPELRLLRCEEEEHCSVLRTIALRDANEGNEKLEDIERDATHVQLVFGADAATTMLARKEVHVELTLASISGRIVKNDSPVHAIVRYGLGATATDPETGRFVVRAKSIPVRGVFEVRPCEKQPVYRELASRDLASGDVYDIELPSNSIRVRAVTAAGKPVAGAVPFVDRFRPDSEQDAFRQWLPATDAKGESVWSPLSPGVPLRVCVAADGYKTVCDDVKLDAREDRTVELKLMPRIGIRGRVVSASPIVGGTLSVVLAGRAIDEIDVAPNGTFELDSVPPPGAVVFFTAASHPLSIARPLHGAEELRYDVAPPPGRNVAVHVASSGDYAITVQFGDMLVPGTILWKHQALRGAMTSASSAKPLVLHDLAANERITIIRGFAAEAWPANMPHGVDPFAIPDVVAQMPRRAVGAEAAVYFE